jgi:hypothetical protein
MLDRGPVADNSTVAMPLLQDLPRWYPKAAAAGQKRLSHRTDLIEPPRSLSVDQYIADCVAYANAHGETTVLPPTLRAPIGIVTYGRYSLTRGVAVGHRTLLAVPSVCELASRVATGREALLGEDYTYYTCPYTPIEASRGDVYCAGLSASAEEVKALAGDVAAAETPVPMAPLPPLPVWVRTPSSQQYRPAWFCFDDM